MTPKKPWLVFSALSLSMVLILIGYQVTLGAADEPPQLYPSAVCGQVGNVVVVEGKNFTPNVLVNITWAGMPLGTDPAPVQVDPSGSLVFQFIIPNDYGGPHPVRVSDGQLAGEFIFDLGIDCPPPATATPIEPTATATVTPTPLPPTPVPEVPRLFCEPEGVLPDSTIQVYGENFHPGIPLYQLRWDGVVIPWSPSGLTVGDDGKFALSVVAPSDSYEMHTLVADDGRGGSAPCYVNMVPRNPTPTSTPTPTLTPTATPTWTPGPPPGVTVTITATPGPQDTCAAIEAAFTRYPLVNSQIDAGITVTNLNAPWPAGEVQLRIWQNYNMFEWDTGIFQTLPAMAVGDMMPLHLTFSSPQSGPTWFQLRLHEVRTGQALPCASAWFPLQIIKAEPYPPPLASPPDNVWLSSRQLTLDWLPAEVPDRAGPVEQYEVQVVDLVSGQLLHQAVSANVTDLAYTLPHDYGARQLAWRSRAYNPAGWSLWSTALYFGVDTVRPTVDISLAGEQGDNGWWRSPLTVRVGGSDAAPGSGLQATFLQVGETSWQQVIPGGATTVNTEGVFDLRAYGRDGATHRSQVAVQSVKIDLRPPDPVEPRFSSEPTTSGWYTRPLTIRVEAEDPVSGIADRSIRLDGGSWQTDEVRVEANGSHTIEFTAKDGAGHDSEIYQTTAKLDTALPAGAIALNGSLCQTCSPATASVSVGDENSGLAHWALSIVLPMQTPQAPTQQANTILASGNDPTRDVAINGGTLPTGPLTLYLAVQDMAGWVTTEELRVNNAPYTPGPTPTPWLMATATPWPAPTGQAANTGLVTPVPKDDQGDDGGKDNNGSGGGGGSGGSGQGGGDAIGATGYPVGEGVVVPAILPVTGDGLPGLWRWETLVFLLLSLAGLILLLNISSNSALLCLPLLLLSLRRSKIPRNQSQDRAANDRTTALLHWYGWSGCCKNYFPSNSTNSIQLKNHTNDKEQ